MALNPHAASVAWMGCASRDAIEHIQHQRRDALLVKAIQGSRFYQAHLGEHVDKQTAFSDLPPVTKSELMSHFADWVTDPEITLTAVQQHLHDPEKIGQPYLGRYMVWESSGSSGIPGVFIQDAESMAVYDALESLRITPQESIQRLCNPLWIGQRIAFVGATSGHFASNVSFERLHMNLPYMRQAMKTFSILQPGASLVAELNEFSPTILATYPSAALQLADCVEHGSLNIRPIEIWVGGERLSMTVRRRIQQVFGATVRASYGASEFLPIARECVAGQLHVNADWVLLEPVDDQYRPVDEETLSDTVLLTNLVNTTQPLIRYDLQDSVRISHRPCGCGTHLPTIEVVGRRDDVICLKDRHGDALSLSPMAITTVLEEEAGVFDFQLIQQSSNQFSLRLGKSMAHDVAIQDRCRAALMRYFSDQGAGPIELQVKNLTAHCIERSGKTKRVVGI